MHVDYELNVRKLKLSKQFPSLARLSTLCTIAFLGKVTVLKC